jgi:hypothetical protein
MDITNSLQYIILVNPTETDGADASPDTAACFYQRVYSVLRALYLSSNGKNACIKSASLATTWDLQRHRSVDVNVNRTCSPSTEQPW